MGSGKITGSPLEGYMVRYSHNIPFLATTAGPYMTRRGARRALAKIRERDDRETAERLGEEALRGTIMHYTPGRSDHCCSPPLNLDGHYGDGTIWACNDCLTLWTVHGQTFIQDTTSHTEDS